MPGWFVGPAFGPAFCPTPPPAPPRARRAAAAASRSAGGGGASFKPKYMPAGRFGQFGTSRYPPSICACIEREPAAAMHTITIALKGRNEGFIFRPVTDHITHLTHPTYLTHATHPTYPTHAAAGAGS